MTDDIRTAYLGRYDEFEAEIVVEILTEAGIFAQTKSPFEEADHAPYAKIMDERGIVMVDATKLDEARALIEQQLPEHLRSIREAMTVLEAGGDEVEVRFEDGREAWQEPDGNEP